MAKNVSSLSVALNATVAPFANAMHAGEQAVDSFLHKVGSVGGALLEMTGVAGLVGGALGSVLALGEGFKLAGEFETANVQLTALSGSADVAKSTLNGLKEFAAGSPFEFPDLLDASKRLISAGVNAQAVVPLLKQVGDVAAGTGRPIGDIADIFSRVAVEGRVGSRELLEFGRNGIPVMGALAQQFHTTSAGVQQLAENGQVGFAQLQQAFATMTGPGGRFAGIVAAQSHTIDGALHTLHATVDDTLADVAERIITAFDFTGVLSNISGFVSRIGPSITAGMDRVVPTFRRLTLAAESAVGGVVAYIVPVFEQVAGAVMTVWGPVSGFISAHSDQIVAAFKGVGAVLAAVSLPAVLGGISAALGTVGTAFTAIGSMMAIPLAPALALGVGLGILAARFDLVATASKVISAVAQFVSDNWRSALAYTVEFGEGLFNAVEGAFNAVAQVVGGVISFAADAIVQGWDFISGTSDSGADMTSGAFDKVTAAAKWLASTSTDVLNGLGYAFNHLNDVIDVETTGMALGVVKAGAMVAYVFTSVVPDVLNWAGGIFSDFGHFTATVFENLGSNIVHVFTRLPALIKGTAKWSDVWTPLTTGFEASARALPQIASRQVGPLEQSLSDAYTTASNKLGDGIGTAIANQAKAGADAAKSITKTVDDALHRFTTPITPKFDKPEKLPEPDKFDIKTALDPQTQTLEVQPEIKPPKLLRFGSAESQLAHFANPAMYLKSATTPGAPAPSAGQFIPPPPSVPAFAGGGQELARVGGGNDKHLKELQTANQWLQRIEYDYRNLSPTIVTIG